ncbi:hypothetical protein [[Clostridium] polysaccharolyticum]|uniref:Uncharacterized protein n=1 Tax=[Clostridium] polysaccharolyticum TaxID=29364 RepID=A0A1H9YSP2_9FIRM|nr:hypothetical protein [[Clostridium] polysaccharolyticum]SES72147.1 hypothetical protein SAMN04487772_102186 [[Clostridium] polysaccharolyticum]
MKRRICNEIKVNEEKSVHTTNQEKIDNTTFSDTYLKTCYSDLAYTVYKMGKGKDISLYSGKVDAVRYLPEPVEADVLVNGTSLTYTYSCNQKKAKETYQLKNSGDIVEIQKNGKKRLYTYDQKR